MYRAVRMFLKRRQRANQFFIYIKEANMTEATHHVLHRYHVYMCLHSRIQRYKL